MLESKSQEPNLEPSLLTLKTEFLQMSLTMLGGS
jgi:hypothetical protein